MNKPIYQREADGKWPDDVVVYTMVTNSDPCTAYHRAFRVYAITKKPEARERWKRILTGIKSQFPKEGCSEQAL